MRLIILLFGILSFTLGSAQTFLISGNLNKTWYLTGASQGNSGLSFEHDNSYTFFADGSFVFDHGTVTKDSTCNVNCSSDLVNITGKWKFANNEKRLIVTALQEKGNPANVLNTKFFDGVIQRLDEDVLILVEEDPTTHAKITVEFRKKIIVDTTH